MKKSPQPNSSNCFVCGLHNKDGLQLRFYNHECHEVVATCTISEKYQGYPGIVHGGVVAAMLDEAAGRSLMIRNGDVGESNPRVLFTVHLDIRYRKNVPIGEPLKLVGTAGKNKGRAAQARAQIYNQSGEVLAEADVLLMDVPEDVLLGLDFNVLGWKIYPEGETSS